MYCCVKSWESSLLAEMDGYVAGKQEWVRWMRGKRHEGFQEQRTGEGGKKRNKEEDKEKVSEHRWRAWTHQGQLMWRNTSERNNLVRPSIICPSLPPSFLALPRFNAIRLALTHTYFSRDESHSLRGEGFRMQRRYLAITSAASQLPPV